MKFRKVIIGTAIALPALIFIFANLISNLFMLAMDRENFIPNESSIFTLKPYKINEGSSSYWLYAEDQNNYYHFTYKKPGEYILQKKDEASCSGFSKNDYNTWCKKQKKTNHEHPD